VPFRVIIKGNNSTRQSSRKKFRQPVERLVWIPGTVVRVVLREPDPGILRVCAESVHGDDAAITIRVSLSGS